MRRTNDISFSEDDINEIRKHYEIIFNQNMTVFPVLNKISHEDIVDEEILNLLSRKIVGGSDTPISRFIEFLENSDWVQQGNRYREKSGNQCPYCQQVIPENIQRDIEAYFNESYEKDCKELGHFYEQYQFYMKNIAEKLENCGNNPSRFLDLEAFKSQKVEFDRGLEENLRLIKGKVDSPSISVEIKSLTDIIEKINKLIDECNKEIQENNRLVGNQKLEKERCQEKIGQLFAFKLDKAITEYKKEREEYVKGKKLEEKELEVQESLLKASQEKKREIEEKMTSFKPTIEKINGYLKGSGFTGFKICENEDKEYTYKIAREDGTLVKQTLSEGERNFLSFLYYYHLVRGSHEQSGVSGKKILVIDDPVSSLDSATLFLVSTFIRQWILSCSENKEEIEQIFVLTHNLLFYHEISSVTNSNKKTRKWISFFTVKKIGRVTSLTKEDKYKIKTTYRLLWDEIKNANQSSNVTIQNTMRRILEHYFTIIGGIGKGSLITVLEDKKFQDQEDKKIASSLIYFLHNGSHGVHDDIFYTLDTAEISNHLKVFKLIFEKSGHIGHYEMMMGENDHEEAAG